MLYCSAGESFCVELVFARFLRCAGKDNFIYSFPRSAFFARAVGVLTLALNAAKNHILRLFYSMLLHMYF